MSISSQALHCIRSGGTASSALAPKPFIASDRTGQHHEHQLQSPSLHLIERAIIMSISWASRAFHCNQSGGYQLPSLSIHSHSSALAEPFIASNRAGKHHEHRLPTNRAGQHHEHQLPSPSLHPIGRASIMSISSQALHCIRSGGPASRASAPKPFIASDRAGQHHEHQLPSPSLHPIRWDSIKSISSQALHCIQFSGQTS